MKDLFKFIKENLFATGIWSVGLVAVLIGAVGFFQKLLADTKSTLMLLVALLPIIGLGIAMIVVMCKALNKEKKK